MTEHTPGHRRRLHQSRRTLAGQGHQPAPEAIVPVLVEFLKS